MGIQTSNIEHYPRFQISPFFPVHRGNSFSGAQRKTGAKAPAF
jgi:hypothetical protein